MIKERRVFLTDIGEVNIKKRKGSRRISIRISENGKISVNIPTYLAFGEGERFLKSREDWLKSNLIRIAERKKEKILFTTDNLPKTRYHEIILSKGEKGERKVKFSQGLCEIFLSKEEDIPSVTTQSFIRNCITEVYRKEARHILVNRCYELAGKNGFVIREVRIKKMKSRWGSCSSRGIINLNLFLMAVPPELADYVIFHELVHTRIMNHGPAFWKTLDQYVGDARAYAKKMRPYSHILSNFAS